MLPMTRNRYFATPFDTLFNMRREVDRLLDGVDGSELMAGDRWTLPTEVRETDGELHFMVELPGVRPEDLDLTVENNTLVISGEKKSQREEGETEGDFHLVERRYGRFQRSFTLPQNVRTDDVRAEHDNGVLTLTFPKKEESRPRRIEIRPGAAARRIEEKSGD